MEPLEPSGSGGSAHWGDLNEPMTPEPAIARWRRALEGWAIPEHILRAAPESPWTFPVELFARRAEASVRRAPSPSTERAGEALPEGGTVVDVGVGGGAASLPLARRASLIVGVDSSEEMLRTFRDAAERVGVEARTVPGRWPDVAPDVTPADVVVCHHVLYNVADLEPFVRALSDHAHRRVVVEMTERHPLAWMNDLWLRFHGLRRPEDPTAADARDALEELGIPTRREDHVAPGSGAGFARREDAVAFIRRRLCLPAERDPEVAEALGDRLAEHDGMWTSSSAAQRLVTLWWDT
jgi:SAM-dependent methyltransferase